MATSRETGTAGRIAITLTRAERDALEQAAREAGEPLSRVAARAVRAHLAGQPGNLGTAPAPRARPPGDGSVGGEPSESPPPWLPPRDEHRARRWWGERERAVARLRERYPVELATIPQDWREDRLLAEHLLALCVWRARLDAGAFDDPRMELAFASALIAMQGHFPPARRARRPRRAV